MFLDEVNESVLSRSLLQANDVIITQTGTRKKRDYGFTVLIPKTNLLLNQRIAAIRFKENYLPKFFCISLGQIHLKINSLQMKLEMQV